MLLAVTEPCSLLLCSSGTLRAPQQEQGELSSSPCASTLGHGSGSQQHSLVISESQNHLGWKRHLKSSIATIICHFCAQNLFKNSSATRGLSFPPLHQLSSFPCLC